MLEGQGLERQPLGTECPFRLVTKKCLRRYHMNEALKEVRTRAGNRGLRGQF